MIKFGDKIRIRKLTKKEHKKIYGEKYSNNFDYKKYLDYYAEDFHKIGKITEIDDFVFTVDFQNHWHCFYPEEVEKAYILSDKIKTLKDIIK
jgi:hypothetical protein